jgi:Helix-turn-helix domain of alkylmercury lyase
MDPTSLELLARQLAEGLRGDHDAFCRELVRLLSYGHPLTRERLAAVLQMTVEQVAEVLASLADLEVDQSGNVVGWGLTFIGPGGTVCAGRPPAGSCECAAAPNPPLHACPLVHWGRDLDPDGDAPAHGTVGSTRKPALPVFLLPLNAREEGRDSGGACAS